MFTTMNYIKIILTIVSITFLLHTACSNGKYSHPSVDKTYSHIHENFIDLTSSDVAKEEKKDPVSQQFQLYLDGDGIIVKMQQIKKDGTSGVSFDAVDLSKDISEDFAKKGEELMAEYASVTKKKLLCQEGVAFGFALIVGGCLVLKNPGGALPGFAITTGCGYGWYSYDQQANALPAHIKAVHTMEEKWNRSFVIIKPDNKQ